MKLKNLRILMILALAGMFAVPVSGQKNNTQSAISTIRMYEGMEDKSSDRAKELLVEAKDFIDKSYSYTSDGWTGKTDAKTLYYKGYIYTTFGRYANDASMNSKFDINSMVDEGLVAYKEHINLEGKRSKDDETQTITNQVAALRDKAANQAISYYNEGKYEKAMYSYAAAGNYMDVVNYFDSTAYYNAGLCAVLIEDWAHAAKYYEKTAKNDFAGAVSYAKWAEALFKLDKETEAITALEEGRKKYPKDPDLYITEGNHWMLKGENDKATEALQKAIDADPNNASVYYAVGALQLEREEYDNAETNYKKALELNPQYLDALYGMGVVYNNRAAVIDSEIETLSDFKLMEDKGKERDELLKQALVYFEKAHQVDPNDKYTLQSLYKIYSKMGDKEKAQKVYDLLKN